MKTNVESINHLRSIKEPVLIPILFILIIFMALLLIMINRNINVAIKKEVVINDHEFVLNENISGRIYLDEHELNISEKKVTNNYVIYRIDDNFDGCFKIKYYQKTTLLKLLKNI